MHQISCVPDAELLQQIGSSLSQFVRFVERITVERPSCRKYKHPMMVGRNSPGAIGYQELTFECSTCGQFERSPFPSIPSSPTGLAGLQVN